jgi:glyoxylase-like metal-dependent hydrolase (beta-lactamase superfamily II)
VKLTEVFYFYPSGKKCCAHTYVIWGKEKKVLIDIGRNQKIDKLAQAMKVDGLDLEKINEIWITHAHPDHATIAPLVKRLNCLVRCHPKAVEILTASSPWTVLLDKQVKIAGDWRKQIYSIPGFIARIGLKWTYGKWHLSLSKSQIQPFKDREVIDFSGHKLGVFFSPGHSDTEVAFWLKKDKILVSGDLIRTDKKIVIPSINTFGADLAQAVKNIRRYNRMARRGLIDTIAPGHGGLVLRDRDRVLYLFAGILRTCKKLRKRAKRFFKKHQTFTLKEILDEIDEFLTPDIPYREKLLLAFVLGRALGKI